MVYEITKNNEFDSFEVYFEGKPSDNVRLALKRLKMRWNPRKKCWYGFAGESEIKNAILEAGEQAEEPATVVTDGYMGGGAVYGSKSNKRLYGADLSKAIRQDLKKAGIKGVSVRCKTYSGGQSITVTLRADKSMYRPLEQYIDEYEVRPGDMRIYTGEETISTDKYFTLDGKEQQEIREKAARYSYNYWTTNEHEINHYHMDKHNYLTDKAIDILKHINNIICAYRYDESNSMVDYFNTNFYYNIAIKPIEEAL